MTVVDVTSPRGGRHEERVNREEELKARLQQAVDWYVMSAGKPKSRALTLAIDELTKMKMEYDKHPREEPLIPRPAN